MTTEISSNLTGKLLLAMPGMTDPRFTKAVIFICAHSSDGAMGLIINHSLLNMTLGQLFAQLHMVPEATAPLDLPVLTGGPVDGARGFLLHTSDFMQPDTIKVGAGFGISATLEALKLVAAGRGPKDMVFALGYSGWEDGQLEQEIQDNAWMIADTDHDIIFNTPIDEKWDRAMARIGVNPALLSPLAGHA